MDARAKFAKLLRYVAFTFIFGLLAILLWDAFTTHLGDRPNNGAPSSVHCDADIEAWRCRFLIWALQIHP